MKDSQLLHLGSRVGYSLKPEKNKYVFKYRNLKRIATDGELVQLTSDSRKAVVLYAYSALYERNYANLKQVFFKHIADTSQIWTTGGCTGVLWQVNQFMLYYLNPQYAKGVLYMSKEEYNHYANQINSKL